MPCPEGQSTLYLGKEATLKAPVLTVHKHTLIHVFPLLGSDSCREFTEKDVLQMMFGFLNNDQWSEEYRKDWSSDTKDPCEWHGVTCDNGEIISLSFPNSGLSM